MPKPDLPPVGAIVIDTNTPDRRFEVALTHSDLPGVYVRLEGTEGVAFYAPWSASWKVVEWPASHMSHAHALELQHQTGRLWDDEGVVLTSMMDRLREEFSDRHPDRELMGTAEDWADLHRLASELDAKR